MKGYICISFILVVFYNVLLTTAQLPPRLNIPGALLVQGARPLPAHRQRGHYPPDAGVARVRKPIPNALPISIPIREETEEDSRPSILDDEVARLSLQTTRLDTEPEPPKPLQFRPERPLPVLRQDVRESASPRQVVRQNLDDEEENIPAIFRQSLPQPVRPPPQPVRQAPQIRQQVPVPQPVRQKNRGPPPPRPQPQYLEDDVRRGGGGGARTRKPQVQIIRKYRTDNEDGSITWGFENEDGTFKEENIGADCIIRGKYGYVDPEGTRREYNYEAGNKCDPEEEYPPEELPLQQNIPGKLNKKQYLPRA